MSARPAGQGRAAATRPVDGPGAASIVAFCCRECAYAAADAAASARTALPASVRLVLVPCTGRVSVQHLVRTLAEGADGVLVAGCLEGQCHYREGNLSAKDRVVFAQRLLAAVGVEEERVRMCNTSVADPARLVAAVREIAAVVGDLGPLRRSVRAPEAAAALPVVGEEP